MTGPTVRQAKILRTMELMQALMLKPMTTEYMAEHLSLHVRNVYRYLKLIEQLGIEVKTKPGPKKMYYIEKCPCCGRPKI